MKYENMEPAIFKERPNRFIAHVDTANGMEVCHVKNTGRCGELLIPGAQIYVQRNNNPNRKTALDLIAVEKGNRLINMDSQAPNKVVEEWLRAEEFFGKGAMIKPEQRYNKSRFDIYAENNGHKYFMEVKGVTLEEDGVVRFPDAPTERGIKHLNELCDCIQDGYEAYVMFVIQMKGVKHFEPNRRTHQAFADALVAAQDAGVTILAYDCDVAVDELRLCEPVIVKL